MTVHIKSMQANRVLAPLDLSSGFLSRMFLVPKGDGSTRPVLNLKRLNLSLSPPEVSAGKPLQNPLLPPTRGFLDQARPFTGLFPRTCKESSPEVLSPVLQ
uniref:Uncharacterized protein n=1 Tax=Cacopsylla melanoneura TaxID=428564 RepID=A0A8D8Z910_9HEMI